MQRWRTPRVPAQPLIDALGGPQAAHDPLGITLDTAYRWRTNRRSMTMWEADKYATRAGLHPATVWPDWFTLADKVLT